MEKRCKFPVIEETFGTMEPDLDLLMDKCRDSDVIEKLEVLPMEDGTPRIKIEVQRVKAFPKEKLDHRKNEFVKGPDQEEILYLQAYMWAVNGVVWNGIEWKGSK